MSVPFLAREFVFAQPDGGTLTVQGWGDQQRAEFRTAAGTPVVRDPITGFFRAVSPSTAGTPATAADGLPEPRWRVRHEQQRQRLREQVATDGRLRAPPQRETVGDFTGLCLPIAFPDVPATISREEIDDFCNRPGYNGFGNNGSVFDYYHDVSGGRLRYRTVVAPLYTAKQSHAHYVDKTLPFGQRARELIVEALTSHRDAGLDFSALTVDAQRGVYALNVFYAGDVVNEWGQGLWPHSSRLSHPLPLAPGKSAFDYQVTATGDALTLGVYCHENGHMLCDFPDLYQYDNTRKGVGRYCLMCLGSYTTTTNPTRVGAYLKFKAGWGEAVPLAAGRQTLSAAEPNRFFIHRRNATEYFIVEARRMVGRDAGLMNDGLAIWHVDELGSNTHSETAPEGHQHYECALLQADGLDELRLGSDDGDAQDLFGVSSGPVFGKGAKVGSPWWDGTPSGLSIHSLEATGANLTFLVELE
ncbi:M6 family metalloprotease domain-containing protein [Variovorax sp. CF079]|uniref:M6 family metalloprotease domain-containing protein n=1 Tax=Variovorax sp. CF079 TaxID=1882774 RepID=UPI000886CFAB|nr:M6 family metalloprotease domain-containing protein [Variovorax sp. CF079]SDC44611.1 M6 family metalloprotease domain-containing protein [Variovorax sp. CF079]